MHTHSIHMAHITYTVIGGGAAPGRLNVFKYIIIIIILYN